MTKFVNFNQGHGGDSSSFFPKMNFFGGSGSFLNNTTLLYVFFALLFIGLVIYLYFSLVKPAGNPSFVPNNEPRSSGNSNVAEMMLFYVDWCPHCKTVKPMFKEFMGNGTVSVNGSAVKVKMVEEKQIQKENCLK